MAQWLVHWTPVERGLGFRHVRVIVTVFLCKALSFHNAPRIKGYRRNIRKIFWSAVGYFFDGLATHLRGGVVLLPVTSCYGNRDKNSALTHDLARVKTFTKAALKRFVILGLLLRRGDLRIVYRHYFQYQTRNLPLLRFDHHPCNRSWSGLPSSLSAGVSRRFYNNTCARKRTQNASLFRENCRTLYICLKFLALKSIS